MKTIQTEP